MADRDSDNPLLSWPIVAALMAAIGGGVLFWPGPLKSSRPESGAEGLTNSFGDQTVQARLWQDPFEAIEPDVDKWRQNFLERIPGYDITDVRRQIQLRQNAPGKESNNDVVVFQVMVSGGPYAEYRESRLRSRYAVVSALRASGYVARDAEHLGVFQAPWLRSVCFETNHQQTVSCLGDFESSPDRLFIPYEWFQRDGRMQPNAGFQHGAILVLWLRDDAFTDNPLQRLAQLREDLTKPDGPALDFELINPDLGGIFSGHPERLLNWTLSCSNEQCPLTKYLTNLQVYSAWSTPADALLWTRATTNRREVVSEELQKLGIVFHNVTCTDDELAGKVVAELKLRGVDLGSASNSIALIAEGDTEYGRALRLAFVTAVNSAVHKFNNFNESLAWTKSNPYPANVYSVSYLRGIDGLLPGQSDGKQDAQKDDGDKGKEKSKSDRLAELEKPQGQSQLDYMPRLAHALNDLERESQSHGHHHRPLRAIGVLGDDVYDKLLLLQSLRKRFPSAVFFTTDLDARLFHPSELKWTRNLVVGSSFGLELGEELQKDVPPFRDTYQTGEYLACLAALGQPAALASLGHIRPQIFEIGRRGAYALDIDTNMGREDPLYRSRPAPFERPLSAGWACLIALAVVVMAACLMKFYFQPARSGWGGLGVFVLWAALLGAFLFSLISGEHRNPNGEPFSLFDGVSIWPCEIVRMAGFTLSLILLATAWVQVTASNKELAKAFDLSTSGATPLQGLWTKLMRKGTFWRRLRRILVLSLCYWMFASLTIGFDLPFVPFRGETSRRVDFWVLMASGAALLMLMFFVVDTALRTRQVANLFAQQPVQWPQALLAKYRRKGRALGAGVKEWLAIQFLAEATENVQKYIYYPFIVLFVMIAARFTGGFNWPIALLLIFCLNALLVFSTSVLLHVTANGARSAILDRLERKLVLARSRNLRNQHRTLRTMIRKINEVDSGAFAPFSQQPFIKAVLMPLVGALLAMAQSLV